MKMDSYMNPYLDRRMTSMIEDWQLSTKRDLSDLQNRFRAVQTDVAELKKFEHDVNKRISNLEIRIKNLKEKI